MNLEEKLAAKKKLGNLARYAIDAEPEPQTITVTLKNLESKRGRPLGVPDSVIIAAYETCNSAVEMSAKLGITVGTIYSRLHRLNLRYRTPTVKTALSANEHTAMLAMARGMVRAVDVATQFGISIYFVRKMTLTWTRERIASMGIGIPFPNTYRQACIANEVLANPDLQFDIPHLAALCGLRAETVRAYLAGYSQGLREVPERMASPKKTVITKAAVKVKGSLDKDDYLQ